MSFKYLNIKQCYESGVDDIVEDYFVPILSTSVTYDRIAGFFSSSCMAIAARGVADFIRNGGKMRLITSPILNKDDIDIIKRLSSNDPDLTLKDFGIDINNLENEFEINHVKAMGWMLSNGLLDIRFAIICNDDGSICDEKLVSEKGLFHQKVGILKDDKGNEISFSGSINETASAWVVNDEEFKVFKEWTDSKEYFLKDKERFEELWNGKRHNVKIFNIPNAIKNEIISYSSDFNNEAISIKTYRRKKYESYDFSNDKELFFYQAEALNIWKANNFRLLFEMATGTGKTRTAIAGIKYLNRIKDRLITIVSTPQNTLSRQWKDEIDKQLLRFDEEIIVDGSIRSWDKILEKILCKNTIGLANHCIFYTTHSTVSSEKFIEIIKKHIDPNTEVLFVGDETHWLGARKLQRALLPIYKYRIGLSATPSRWFDESGTLKITEYYGNKNFEFTIKDALTQYNPLTGKHFLVNYKYLISKVGLDEEESLEYKKFSKQITKLWSYKDENSDKTQMLERLIEKRANIIKNANSKYIILDKILDEIAERGRIENLLIFVSPQQILKVLEILAKKGLIFHKLTEKEGTKPDKKYGNKSEREFIISKFKSKEYQVIVAIKCMDEGIDVPTADTGILMASSTNPREYIQRIGRIIRQSPGKVFANLYDICVDTISDIDDEYLKIEQVIRKKEKIRLKEIAENAINSIDALNVINSLN